MDREEFGPDSGPAAASLDEVKQTANSDLQYVSLQLDGQTYGGWYRQLADGRMELLALANMHCERRTESSPVEQARGMLADFIRTARPRVSKPAPQPAATTASSPVSAHPEGTLGALLYADAAAPRVAETEWIGLVRAIAARDLEAFGNLYRRTLHIVFTLATRLTGDGARAAEVAVDVFQDVWQRAAEFDNARGTVLGWVMHLTRARALALSDSRTDLPLTTDGGIAHRLSRRVDQAQPLRHALAALDVSERQALETVLGSGSSCADLASGMQKSVEAIDADIDNALAKLKRSLVAQVDAP